MSRALVSASDAAEQSREKLQAQGKYLETVLGSLSAGVLTLEQDGRLVRINAAAESILGLPPGTANGQTLQALSDAYPLLTALDETISRHLERGHREWQEEIRLEPEQGKLVLLARGSVLPADDQGGQGQVVVFDDVTVLNQAQRDAAWAEVARRLAHEVINPLTPIRLAAERLRMKLMDKLDSGDADMLDRSASTIVAQVEALRRLVDAFGDYARAPELERQALRLDELIAEVCHLYRQGNPQLALDTDLVPGPDNLHADAGQLRQLLHNLISNAQEATPPGRAAQIHIQTRVVTMNGHAMLQLDVKDNGPGFPDEVLAKPFEPYVTHKSGGSGLGLAICRKIVTDHDGSIEISNPAGGGALARIVLPMRVTGEQLENLRGSTNA
jgi:PAS domain S-box-containing protein